MKKKGQRKQVQEVSALQMKEQVEKDAKSSNIQDFRIYLKIMIVKVICRMTQLCLSHILSCSCDHDLDSEMFL